MKPAHNCTSILFFGGEFRIFFVSYCTLQFPNMKSYHLPLRLLVTVWDEGWHEVLHAGITGVNCQPQPDASPSSGTSSHHLSPHWNRQKLQPQNILRHENDKPNKKGNSFSMSSWPGGERRTPFNLNVPIWILTGDLFFLGVSFPYPLELIKTHSHYYSCTSCTRWQTVRLTSLLKQPWFGKVC